MSTTNSSSIQFVLWDLDGTLVDSVADIAGALNILFAELGLAVIDAPSVRDMIGDGMAKLLRRAFAAQGIEPDESFVASGLDRLIEIYAARPVVDTDLYSGVVPALNRLRDAGILQAVCTNKPASIAESILEALGIRCYFSYVTGGDSTAFCKPHPLPIEFTAERFGRHTSDGIMIGDSPADSRAARSAGMPVAIVDHGYSKVPLASIDCDFLVSDIDAFANRIVSSYKGSGSQ